MLLKQGKAFSSFSVNDVPKAKEFYVDVGARRIRVKRPTQTAPRPGQRSTRLPQTQYTHPQPLRS